jgi:hypothetical protein
MMLRSKTWLAVLTAGLVLIAAGSCSPGLTLGSGDGLPGSAGEDCDSNGFLAFPSPSPSPSTTPVPSIQLPADAVLVLATRCLFEMRDVPGDGTWMYRIEQRADSGLDALATALRLPDEQTPKGGNCAAIGYPPNIITVTDTTGRMLHPVVPTGVCGAPLLKTIGAINAVPWLTTATVKLRQVRTALEVSSGCSGFYKPVVAMRAADGGHAAEPPKIDIASSPLDVCIYALGDADTIDAGSQILHIGRLSKASIVEGDAARALLTAVAAAPAATTTCTDEAPFATITGKGVPELEVELGGCYRALVLDSLRQLDAATVQAWHLD